MKSGTNFTDRNRIKEWHAESASVEEISRNLKLKPEVVKGYVDSLKPKRKAKAKVESEESILDLGDEIPRD